MRLLKPDWYGLDHNAVKTQFEGDLSFCNEFCVLGEYAPSAVYVAAKPNKAKGHKKYALLTKSNGQWYIRGMSPQKMRQFRYQKAIHCLKCDDIVYSVNRHDMRHCTCGNVAIDGGKDYTKINFKSGSTFEQVVIDLITCNLADPNKLYAKVRKKKTKKAKKA